MMPTMFELSEEHRMLQDLVAKFIDRDVMPLEKAVLARETSGQKSSLTAEEEETLLGKCRELGLWGLDVPEEFGGANLPTIALIGVYEEQGRTCVPFTFPPDSPNLHMLKAVCNPEQRRKYLEPYARGDAHSAIAISEPNAGGDPAGMITRAVKDGDDWVINGRKIWVSRVPQADFVIVMARTGEGKRHDGVTAFIVERGTEGFNIEREIPMLGGQRTYELTFDDCRVPASQLLGQEGRGFAPMQLRLTVRRLQIHACRLMVYDAAAKSDAGKDVRTEASMVKLYGSEMATETIDHAMQTFGAMGVAKELPLQLMAQKVRTMRVYEGPSEVHRMVIARRLLQDRR
jgi:acyl-CoA dehydrogenase